MVTGARRRLAGRLWTTSGRSAVARVASCARMPGELPAPSAGEPMRRLAAPLQLGHGVSAGADAIECCSVKSGQPCPHRNT
uniref:Uncharacterized protein n=1 Tax=Mycolicibacterium mucogenicum DSM 44124 TaxID=1226753 RepID=A0A8H2JHE1_MYCMU